MSKKHYEALAKLAIDQVDRFKSEEDRVIFLYKLALILKADNPNFRKWQFLDACGIVEEQ